MIRRLAPYFLTGIFSLGLFSCQVTKYVPEDEYLLQGIKIEAGDGEFDKKELDEYIKQKPNKRILFWRFYLSLYNLSNPEKEKWPHGWLRDIGEPPSVYDEQLKHKSTEQLGFYMRNKGFYEATVNDTIIYKRKRRAKIVYRVEPGVPYKIKSMRYTFEDPALAGKVLADTSSTKVRVGALFDVDVLNDERVRIEKLLRDSGYYAFKRDFVYYEVDSALNAHLVDVTLGVHNYPQISEQGRTVSTPHPVYTIRDVYMTSDFTALSVGGNSNLSTKRDTLIYDGIHLLYDQKINVKPGLLTQKNYIMPGTLFDATMVNNTNRNLNSLSAFRMVDVRFTQANTKEPMLDCAIMAVPATKQSYTIKLEGTNSAGNFGAAANIGYRHRNLFGGSETFDLSFLAAVENIKTTDDVVDSTYTGRNVMQEYAIEARLTIPRFLLPIKTERFIRKYNPKTNIRLLFNYQKRPDYIRTLANASFGYDWKATSKLIHRVYPMELSLIQTPYKSDEFIDWLEGKYLFYSYEPHLILDSRYSMVWSNQKVLKNQNFQDVRINLETAGNLLYAGFSAFAEAPENGIYQVLGLDFAQYFKADVDMRFYNFLYDDISLVLRGFAGVGYAYGNSSAMPFEKQYFSGGANSIRAWQVKNLGPGSYKDPDESTYPNQTGDVKLEANMEYRFKLFWRLEAALFLDVGNIWSLSAEDDREGAGFEFKRFYKELAVGTGVGARAVFSFFVFRFDMGVPLRNPYAIEGSNWLLGNSGISGSDLTFNFAIGYPF